MASQCIATLDLQIGLIARSPHDFIRPMNLEVLPSTHFNAFEMRRRVINIEGFSAPKEQLLPLVTCAEMEDGMHSANKTQSIATYDITEMEQSYKHK